LDTCQFWVDYDEAHGLPPNAVKASNDGLYIGRAHHRGTVTPGGIRNNICTLAWDGFACEKRDFQVLCDKNVNWVKSWEGSVPLHALPAGETKNGCALFIGRVMYEGIYHIGKVHTNDQVCYVPLNGDEMPYLEYEVLVLEDNHIEQSECVGR
jgi:hypothetical protein